MPKSKLNDHAQALAHPRDPIMEMIQGRMKVGGYPISVICNAIGTSDKQAYNRLRNWPSAKWPYGDLIKVCRTLGISTEELREKVRV